MSFRPFKLERYFAKHEFSAKYLLGSSDPEAMSISELMSFEHGSEAKFKDIWLGYTESLGHPELRRDIAATYESVSPEQIMVFTGAQEPIFAFINAVFEPRDHLIVHFPSYQSHYSIALDRGIEVTKWYGEPENNWAPDLDKLPGLIKPKTKAILICTPHNPTGYLFEHTAWQKVIEIARSNNLYLFCDEVYRGTEHRTDIRLPQMADYYEKGISLNCLSKNCGLAGLRIGWIATKNADVFNRLAAFKDYLTICNSAPSEFLAGIAVRNCQKIFQRQRQRLNRNIELLEAFFKHHSSLFKWQRPYAGTITFPELLGDNALDFCENLVDKTGIMLIPGIFFDMEKQFIRFGYGRESFPEVLDQFNSHLIA